MITKEEKEIIKKLKEKDLEEEHTRLESYEKEMQGYYDMCMKYLKEKYKTSNELDTLFHAMFLERHNHKIDFTFTPITSYNKIVICDANELFTFLSSKADECNDEHTMKGFLYCKIAPAMLEAICDFVPIYGACYELNTRIDGWSQAKFFNSSETGGLPELVIYAEEKPYGFFKSRKNLKKLKHNEKGGK